MRKLFFWLPEKKKKKGCCFLIWIFWNRDNIANSPATMSQKLLTNNNNDDGIVEKLE